MRLDFSIAALAVRSIAQGVLNMPLVTMVRAPGPKGSGKANDWRYGGRAYPHSGNRQRARYARQIEAGQLSMDSIKERANG